LCPDRLHATHAANPFAHARRTAGSSSDAGRLAAGVILARKAIPARHIPEDHLELYALDRLPEADAAPVEEHLLVCEVCQERLAKWDEFVRAMRGALRISNAD
jgi:hypothetical protein